MDQPPQEPTPAIPQSRGEMIAIAMKCFADGFAQKYARKQLIEAGNPGAAVDDAVFEAWRLHSGKRRAAGGLDPKEELEELAAPGRAIKNFGRSIIGFALTVWITGYGILRLFPKMLSQDVIEVIALTMIAMWAVAAIGGIIWLIGYIRGKMVG